MKGTHINLFTDWNMKEINSLALDFLNKQIMLESGESK